MKKKITLKETINNFIIKRIKLFNWTGWFLLFNLIIVLILLFRYIKFICPTEGLLAFIYLWLALIGHFSSMVIILYFLLFIPLIIIYPKLWFIFSIYIILDCWRFDMLAEEITPNIYKFVKEKPTLKFKNHISGGNGTRVGIFILFYGLYGSYFRLMNDEQIGPVLVRELLKQKYQPRIFASSRLTAPPLNRTVFTDIKGSRTHSKGSNAHERGQNIVDDWLQWIEKRDKEKPFFKFLFFDSGHTVTVSDDYPRLFEPMWERVDYHVLNNDYDRAPFLNLYKLCFTLY